MTTISGSLLLAVATLHKGKSKQVITKMQKEYRTGINLPEKNSLGNYLKSHFLKDHDKLKDLKHPLGMQKYVNSYMWYVLVFGKPKCVMCKSSNFFHLKDRPLPESCLCCSKCSSLYALEKIKEQNIRIHGVENIFSSEEFNKNRIKYLQDKYGKETTGPTLVPGAAEKIRKTSLKNHGVEHFAKSDKVKAKRVGTSKKRYGHDSYLATPECIESRKAACLEYYGVDHPSKANEIKAIKANQVENRTDKDRKLIKKKTQTTNLEKWGVKHPMQNPDIHEKASRSRTKKMKWRNKILSYQGCEGEFLESIKNYPTIKSATTKRKEVGVIHYKFKQDSHIYYPDIKLTYKDGKEIIIECKANRWLGYGFDKSMFAKNKAKYLAAQKHYKKLGKIFVLVLSTHKGLKWISNPDKNLSTKLDKILNA